MEPHLLQYKNDAHKVQSDSGLQSIYLKLLIHLKILLLFVLLLTAPCYF